MSNFILLYLNKRFDHYWSLSMCEIQSIVVLFCGKFFWWRVILVNVIKMGGVHYLISNLTLQLPYLQDFFCGSWSYVCQIFLFCWISCHIFHSLFSLECTCCFSSSGLLHHFLLYSCLLRELLPQLFQSQDYFQKLHLGSWVPLYCFHVLTQHVSWHHLCVQTWNHIVHKYNQFFHVLIWYALPACVFVLLWIRTVHKHIHFFQDGIFGH